MTIGTDIIESLREAVETEKALKRARKRLAKRIIRDTDGRKIGIEGFKAGIVPLD